VRCRRLSVPLALAALLLAGAPGPARAQPRVSFNALERDVMCVVCGTSLNLADSPQADRERAFIRGLIAQGDSEATIKRKLVGQYGPEVLALPQGSAFDLSAYLVPILVGLTALVLLILLLPRWRRRAKEPVWAAAGGLERATSTHTFRAARRISEADRRRLEEELARFDA
jgi:cytochrome c-type biogenesis protein CcmH